MLKALAPLPVRAAVRSQPTPPPPRPPSPPGTKFFRKGDDWSTSIRRVVHSLARHLPHSVPAPAPARAATPPPSLHPRLRYQQTALGVRPRRRRGPPPPLGTPQHAGLKAGQIIFPKLNLRGSAAQPPPPAAPIPQLTGTRVPPAPEGGRRAGRPLAADLGQSLCRGPGAALPGRGACPQSGELAAKCKFPPHC